MRNIPWHIRTEGNPTRGGNCFQENCFTVMAGDQHGGWTDWGLLSVYSGVCNDGFGLDSLQLPQIQHNWVFNGLMRFLSYLFLWMRDGTKRKRRKKEAHDVNLFASCNNNPVIPPRKCLSCLMPLYAFFFFSWCPGVCLFIYLQISFAGVENEGQEMPIFNSTLLRFIL